MRPTADSRLSKLYITLGAAVTATLLRYFGTPHLGTVERIVHDAFLRTASAWHRRPLAREAGRQVWQSACRTAVEVLTRRGECDSKVYEVMVERDGKWSPPKFFLITEGADDLARYALLVTDPSLPRPTALPLALDALFGLGPFRIRSITCHEGGAPVARLVEEGKSRLRSRPLPDVHSATDAEKMERWAAHTADTLCEALTLCYDYSGFTNGELAALCDLAARVAAELARLVPSPPPSLHALRAQALFYSSMVPGRLSRHRPASDLARHRRALWNRGRIREAARLLEKSACGTAVSRPHLEAAVAATHALAPTAGRTDWSRIVSLYDTYLSIHRSAEVALRRAVAVARLHGTDAALEAMEGVDRDALGGRLRVRYHVMLGDLWGEKGRLGRARGEYEKALELCPDATLRAEIEARAAARGR